MFNKTANTPTPQRTPAAPQPTLEPAAPRRAPSPSRPPSLLGPDLVFEGSITGEGELHIEGAVRGEIAVARLVVGERAQVEGAIRGGAVEVRGRVHGNIEAKTVKLYESAHVEGDIVHEQLSIDVGAFFQGRCQQAKRAPAPAAQPAPAQPSAQVIELDKADKNAAG
jgi:cytoskeletal protein CcmA (bactofilin family)